MALQYSFDMLENFFNIKKLEIIDNNNNNTVVISFYLIFAIVFPRK